MMRTLLMTASLLTLGVLGAQPAAACTSIATDPGEPAGGVAGYTAWYAAATAHSACQAEVVLELAVAEEAGEALAPVGPVLAAAGALVHVGNLAGAAEDYAGAIGAVAVSQTNDACAGLVGETLCPVDDAPVSQQRGCDVELPGEEADAIVGDTRDNLNSGLQQTCLFEDAVQAVPPSNAEVSAFLGSLESGIGGFVGSFGDAPGDLSVAAGEATLGLGDDALVNTCVWIFDDPSCLS